MGSIRSKRIPDPLEAAVAEVLFVDGGEFGDALLDKYVGIQRNHRLPRLRVLSSSAEDPPELPSPPPGLRRRPRRAIVALAMGTLPQRVIVTGGAGSLAKAVAAESAAAGWQVEAPDRAELDVTSPEAIARYFATHPADLLVCAAGVTRDAPVARLSPEAWQETWDVNYAGALQCARAALPGMIRRHSGHIVLVSSHSALHPPPGQAAYATAKSALLGLAADLALRHGADNIRCNAVLPGFLETRMTAPVSANRRAEALACHALGRFNTCEAAARFIRFLHAELPHTSGQVFQLDSRPAMR